MSPVIGYVAIGVIVVGGVAYVVSRPAKRRWNTKMSAWAASPFIGTVPGTELATEDPAQLARETAVAETTRSNLLSMIPGVPARS